MDRQSGKQNEVKLDENGEHTDACECCECYGHPEEQCANSAELVSVDDDYCTFESICKKCGEPTTLEYSLIGVESA